MFYVAPLALIALLGLAQDGVVTRRRRPLLIAAAIAAVLPFFIPFARFIGPPVVSDTFGLMPWWWVQDQGIHFDKLMRWFVLAFGILGGGRRSSCLLAAWALAASCAALVGAFFRGNVLVRRRERPARDSTAQTLASSFSGIKVPHPDWIDRIVGHDANVDYLWDGVNSYSVWEPEFFNRSFRRVFTTGGPGSDVLPETAVARPSRRRAMWSLAGGIPVSRPVRPDGRLERRAGDRDRQGDALQEALQLFRVDGPVVVLTRVTGYIYPGDTWSGQTGRTVVTYRRLDCVGRPAHRDPRQRSCHLHDGADRGGARQRQDRSSKASIAPARLGSPSDRAAPPDPGHGHTCFVYYETARTLVPARVHPKTSTDPRPLGAHFLHLHVRAVRIAFDVSPLSHTRTGVNNYILGAPCVRPR